MAKEFYSNVEMKSKFGFVVIVNKRYFFNPSISIEKPVEHLTWRSEPSASSAVDLVLEWQGTRLRLPFDSGFAAPDGDDRPSTFGPD